MIKLKKGAAEVRISPEGGGCVQSWMWQGRHLLRPGPARLTPAWDARTMAAFPLVPFPGRIQNGQFSTPTHQVTLAPNMPPEPHAIHGFGWQQAWTVQAAGPDHLSLAHQPDDEAWPWSYVAHQHFTLHETQLLVDLQLTNQSSDPMPAGLGWHPYFPRPGARVMAQTLSIWEATLQTGSPVPRPIPPHQSLVEGPDVDALRLDHAFDVPHAPIRLHWPTHILELSSDPVFSKIVVYVPENEDFFCVEPLTQMPDAVNSTLDTSRTGLTWLAPGETLSGQIRLTVTAVS